MSQVFQDFFYADFGNKVYAAEPQQDHTNIVAVLVDNNIYDSISDDIQWYATKYIQGAQSVSTGSSSNNNTSSVRAGLATTARGSIGFTKGTVGGISTVGLGAGGIGTAGSSIGGVGAFLPTTTSGSSNTGSTSSGNAFIATSVIGNSSGSKGGTFRSNASMAQLAKDINLINTSLLTDYDRYNHISNSKVLVLRVDTDNITAPEITKILENLYFDGIRDESSNLVGVILIGDIPLPVVNQDGYIFPTIFPYVDFEEQKFVRDESVGYFVYNNNKKGQAEIWHGMIKFDTVQEYKDYFDKLQEYASNPSEFIGKNFWYEDFIGNQKYFYDDGLNAYINNFLFAEDLGYERYSDLMVSIMQGIHNDTVSSTLAEFGEMLSGADSSGFNEGLSAFMQSSDGNTSTPTLTIKKLLYEGYISSYASLLGVKYLDMMNKNVSTANRWVEEYSLGNGDPENPIITTRSSMDSHYMKIEQKDETLLRSNGGLEPLFIAVNNVLEDAVDTKVENEKYWLNEVIPLTYLSSVGEWKGLSKVLKLGTYLWKKYDAYENYLFGTKAANLTSMKEATTYRGTYRNYQGISGLTINDIQNSSNPSTDINVDLNKKSVGGSYEIFAQQVDANRGYNTNNGLSEYEQYEQNKISKRQYWSYSCPHEWRGLCFVRRHRISSTEDGEECVIGNIEKQGGCEDMASFTNRWRGGASPLNLTGSNTNNTDMVLSNYNYKDAVSPIYDIAGSKSVQTKKANTDSYAAIAQYSALQIKRFVLGNGYKYRFKNKPSRAPGVYGKGYNEAMGESVKFTNWIMNSQTKQRSYITPKTATSVDYFSKYNSSATKENNIIKITHGNNSYNGSTEIYTYKTLDSRVKNTSSTTEDIYGMNYSAFSDSRSPILDSYIGLNNKIQSLSDKLSDNPMDNSGTGGSHALLNEIKAIVTRANLAVNTGLQLNYLNTTGLINLTTGQIQAKINLLNNAFSTGDFEFISGTVGTLQDQFQSIGEFTSNFDFYDIAEYWSEKKTEFTVNNWDLVYLNSWKNNINSELNNIKNSYTSILNNSNSRIATTRALYTQIRGNGGERLGAFHIGNNTAANGLDNVLNKINAISGAALNSPYGGCSNEKFSALCTSIQNLRNTISSYGLLVWKATYDIGHFEYEANQDESSSETGVFMLLGCGNADGCTTLRSTPSTTFNTTYTIATSLISAIPGTNDTGYKFTTPGMNISTSDRPIDSPKYMTFKGIGGDKVTFIYPDIYKVEVFTGTDGNLTLLEPNEIANNIRQYLKDVVKKYNSYLTGQANKRTSYYNNKASAFNTLNSLDPLASPNHKGDSVRPYNLFDENYLINNLVEKINNSSFFSGNMGGLEPIEFLANMLYYQNIEWPTREVGATIQDDMDNIRTSFDVNKKISHVLNNYLISDNNKGSFLTPGYRDEGYEVAYINSDGGDYIVYDVQIPDMDSLKSSSASYSKPSTPSSIEKSQLEEELANECGIPEDGNGVLLFDLSTLSSPWLKAIKCRWEKMKEKPLDIDVKFTWQPGGFVPSQNSDTQTAGSQSILDQIGISNNTNNNILNNTSSTEYEKLSKIDSYVELQAAKNTINVDSPTVNVSISSKNDVGDIYFYIMNVGNNSMRLSSENGIISQNITAGSPGYFTGHFTANPFDTQNLQLQLQSPKAGSELLVVYMCTSSGANLNNCIKKTSKFTVIPGEISSITIESLGNTIIAGSQMPIVVKGLDSAGNSVGQLFSQNFTISVTNSILSSQSAEGESIKFSDFDKSSFVINANGNYTNGSQIKVSVSGNIGGSTGVQAEKTFNVVRGKLNISATGAALATNPGSNNATMSFGTRNTNSSSAFIPAGTTNSGTSNSGSMGSVAGRFGATSNSSSSTLGIQGTSRGASFGNASGRGSKGAILISPISGILSSGSTTLSPNVGKTQLATSGNEMTLNVYLPDENTYSYVDEYNMTQVDSGALPKINLRLTDTNGTLLSNLDAVASVSSKKSLLKIGTISQKTINKSSGSVSYQLIQNKFQSASTFVIQSGVASIYLLPNFKAGNDEITINVPGIDPIKVNVNVHSGSPRVVKFVKKDDSIKAGTTTNASVKVFDNRDNLITDTISVKLGTMGHVSIAGFTGSMSTVQVTNGVKTFDIVADNEGGRGYLYGIVDNIAVTDQQAGYEEILVQATMLPETGLNIMYLNLFGSDWGNQWGFMSDNEKYVQKLISNSDKLLTTTTQLVTPEKIKLFALAVNKDLFVSNILGKDIELKLGSGLNIGIDDIGYIGIARNYLNNFNLYELGVSTSNRDSVFNSIVSSHKNENLLIYIPETTDSIITGNEVMSNSIFVNGSNVFNLNNGVQDLALSISLSDTTLYDYQAWNVVYDGNNIGTILIIINNKNYQLSANVTNPDYDGSEVWLGGSTNNKGIGIYEIDSQLGDSSLGFDSIQDSKDPSLGIGFTADFKNITNFGEGENVGEATVPFSSEFLINIGDPLLKRINDNETAKVYTDTGALSQDTEFDKGLGEIIYSDPTNTIYKVINIDFNNDNLEDIIVVYSDGTIKLLKNYGGNTPFQNLGDSMVLADRIKDVVVGDVDGNNYQDIIIWTQSDVLRVYHNYSGVFEVDGYPVCLNINVHAGEVSETPEKIDGLFQIFFEDMDNDGSMDIITNDHLGFIKIFYGGKDNSFNEDNYVSTNKYLCDANWYKRLSNNSENDSLRNTAWQQQSSSKSSNSFLPTSGILGGAGKGNTSNTNSNTFSGKSGNNTLVNNAFGNSNDTGNINTVYRFAVRANETVKVKDNSLFRRKGINSDDSTGSTDTSDVVDTSKINDNGVVNKNGKITKVSQINTGKLVGALSATMDFDIGAAEDQYMMSSARYTIANFGNIPVYESGIVDESDVEYVTIGWLTGSDPIIVYKKYEDINGDVLEDGDKVEVTVTLQATNKLTGTFIDIISGPWIIPVDEEYDMIQNFWFESGTISPYKVENELQMHRDLENGRYMIDNIMMNSGDIIKIHYRLYYDGSTQITEINLKDVNGNNYNKYGGTTGQRITNHPEDGFIDIKTQPTDGCNASMFVIFNAGSGNSRNYQAEYVDLGSLLGDIVDTAQGAYNESVQGVTNSMGNVLSNDGIDLSGIPGGDSIFNTVSSAVGDMFSEAFSMSSIMGGGGVDLSNIINTPNQIVDALLGDVTNKIEDLVSKSCGGFDLGSLLGLGGGNCGLPVPFNESFLGAGDYHLFGCFNIVPLTELIGKGMPLLTFPGNWGPIYGVYIPAPGIFGYPFKGGGDNFSFGNPGGAYPSLFRLYVMPTLTAELGIAICLGPYAVAQAIPDPIGSVGGNCVVFSVPLPCKGASESTSPTETYSSSQLEAFSDIKSCEKTNNAPMGANESNSCIQLMSQNGNTESMTTATPAGSSSSLYNNGSYMGGFINIEKTPSTALGFENDKEAISIGGVSVSLVGGANSPNKILGSKAQGLIEKIIKKWLDKQIKYMMATLTNFKVGITWPDFSKLLAGFDIKDTFKFRNTREAWNNQYSKESLTEKEKCENKGKEWKNGSCVSKTNKTNNDKSLESLEGFLETNWVSRDQIENMSESNFANPLQFLEEAFDNIPLINFSTQDITVNVPMITSEDIIAYASLANDWINKQEKILEEWKELFYGLLSFCGGENVRNMSDLKNAVKNLKEQLLNQFHETWEGINEKIDELTKLKDNGTITPKQEEELKQLKDTKDGMAPYHNRITTIEEINEKYDLSVLDGFTVWERTDGNYLIQVGEQQIEGNIMPVDIYLLYDKKTKGLSMFTNGLAITTGSKLIGSKIILKEITLGDGVISNGDLKIVGNPVASQANQCIDLFLGGSFDLALKNFLSIQSSADTLIGSVKQNLETLELYKQFPMQLYEWVHLLDEYLAEVSSFVNSFLSTLSVWMETNATRYTQYVNAIITIMTVLETYQAIIDLAADRSESCSTCSNDNYDQFVCKLGLICPDGLLPTIPIPPMKIPSIYLDFSHINLGTEIKLPKFSFVTESVPLPDLPDLPSPPQFDFSATLDETLGLGLSALGDFIANLLGIDGNIAIPAMPIIPEPPLLPSPPSFSLSANIELPLLPPAPKIPALPSEITAAIKSAKSIGKILCLVKNFPLVNETSVKAKIEQMSQRTYEVPFWDTMDQTFNSWGAKIGNDSWISEWLPFMTSSEFKDVDLKGFDISLESYVNLQLDFDEFYDFIDSIVSEVNDYTNSAVKGIGLEEALNKLSKMGNDFTENLQKCINDPLGYEECCSSFGIDCTGLKERLEKVEAQLKILSDSIKNKFADIIEKKQRIEDSQNFIDSLLEKINNLIGQRDTLQGKIDQNTLDLSITTNDTRRLKLQTQIDLYNDRISKYDDEIERLNIELDSNRSKLEILQEKYGPEIKEYDEAMEKYNELYGTYQEIMDTINSIKESIMGAIKDGASEISSEVNGLFDNEVFDEISEWNNRIQSQMEGFEENQAIRRQQRSETLQGLFDSKVDDNTISYAEYDDEIFENDIKLLTDSLNVIKDSTDNASIIKKANDSLKLINSDTNIYPASDSINSIKKQYATILDGVQENTENLSDMILNNYDQFLYAVANNDKKLVSNDDIEIELSSNLFEMDSKAKDTLKGKDNINKMYLDYYNTNLDGYLNAMNNYSAESLNMSESVYNINKQYLQNLKDKTELAYNVIENADNPIKLAQNTSSQSSSSNSSSSSSSVNLSSYFDGQIISTPEGGFILANTDYTKKFQKQNIMADLNKDGKNDLVLWDDHNIYVKYRDNNTVYANTGHNTSYYVYNITSYKDMLIASKNNNGYTKIGNMYVKLCDNSREVKDFKYAGGDFDTISVSWSNSKSLGDDVDGYLVKMIHRADIFNDKEEILTSSNRAFYDKKYILVLPEGSTITGMKLRVPEGITDIDNTGNIFDINYYNPVSEKINLTIQDIPRNWQYSEVYTLNKNGTLYSITSPSSNQIVGGPQIIADNMGPTVEIDLYRPSTDTVLDNGENLAGYVSTNYVLRANWEDNALLSDLWITDEDGEILRIEDNLFTKTGYIELDDLFFTKAGVHHYYFVGTDINGNSNSTDVTLTIMIPSINIINIGKHNTGANVSGTPVSVTAEISQDLDEGVVQFLRQRNNIWELLTGTVGGIKSDKYNISPNQTIVTGGYYDFGEDIGLYLSSGDLAVSVNPKNGKIVVNPGYEDIIDIEVDYANHAPVIKIVENGTKILMMLKLKGEELISIDKLANGISVKDLSGNQFGSFSDGKAIVENDTILLYISPTGDIYTDTYLYGDYSFDDRDESVIYTFKKTKNGSALGNIKIKMATLSTQ